MDIRLLRLIAENLIDGTDFNWVFFIACSSHSRPQQQLFDDLLGQVPLQRTELWRHRITWRHQPITTVKSKTCYFLSLNIILLFFIDFFSLFDITRASLGGEGACVIIFSLFWYRPMARKGLVVFQWKDNEKRSVAVATAAVVIARTSHDDNDDDGDDDYDKPL